jgi:hypothetical protein
MVRSRAGDLREMPRPVPQHSRPDDGYNDRSQRRRPRLLFLRKGQTESGRGANGPYLRGMRRPSFMTAMPNQDTPLRALHGAASASGRCPPSVGACRPVYAAAFRSNGRPSPTRTPSLARPARRTPLAHERAGAGPTFTRASSSRRDRMASDATEGRAPESARPARSYGRGVRARIAAPATEHDPESHQDTLSVNDDSDAGAARCRRGRRDDDRTVEAEGQAMDGDNGIAIGVGAARAARPLAPVDARARRMVRRYDSGSRNRVGIGDGLGLAWGPGMR